MNAPGTERRALAAVAAQFFINGALIASMLPRLPEIRDRAGIGTDRLGLLLSVGGAISLIGSAAAGRLIERLGSRAVMFIGSVAASLSVAAIGITDSALILAVGIAAMWTFDVLADIAMNLQGSWLSAARRVPVMNRLHGLWSLGTVVGGLVAARLANSSVSLRQHLLGVALVLATAAIIVNANVLAADQAAEEEPEPALAKQRRWRPSATMLALVAAGFFALIVESGSLDWAAFRLTDDLTTMSATGALAYVGFTGGMMIGRLSGDAAVSRLSNGALILFSCGLGAIGLATASLVDNVGFVIVGYSIAGFGTATIMPGLYDRAAKMPGRRRSGLGALTAGLRVATLCGPVAIGWIASRSTVGTAVAAVTLPSIGGLFLAMMALRVRRE